MTRVCGVDLVMSNQYSILIDGGFFTRKLYPRLNRHPRVEDVVSEIDKLRSYRALERLDLLRVYYYDSKPATGRVTHPITGDVTNLAETEVFRRNQAFLDKLELQPNVALRLGELSAHGWKLKRQAINDEGLKERSLTAEDFSMDLEQKGVDLRIGLDIARLSLTQSVHTIVVVTGDSDLVPAFKFARREGTRVVLSHMGHGVKRELKAHTDLILEENDDVMTATDDSAPQEASTEARSTE